MKLLPSALLGLPALLLGTTLQAATLVDVNFSSMTVNQAVEIAAPVAGALPVTKATSGSIPSGATTNITNGFTSTKSPFATFGSGNVMVISRPATTASGSIVGFEVNPADRITSGIVSLQFDLMIDNMDGRSGNLFISARNSSYTTISSLTIGNNGSLTLNAYSAPGTASGSTSLPALSLATSYHIELRLNYDTALSQAYVNDIAVGTAQAFATTNGVLGFAISTSASTIGRWAFDNVSVQTIPEPSGVALLSSSAVVGLGLARARRRQKVAA